jgi:hypothetical protein
METKKCLMCKKTFERNDYPHTFERMVTCGSVECMGKRRKQLWKKRYNKRGE